MIYLDHAATSLIKPISVGSAVSDAIRTMASPGRGGHLPAMRAADVVFECRSAAAEFFHAQDPEQVVFTMNATHALNIAIRSLARPGMRVLISGFEHNSVTRPLHAIGAEIVVAGRQIFDADRLLQEFAQLMPTVDLVVCTQVSNVFGYILPLNEIAAMCRKHRIPLIADASQGAGALELDFDRLGAAYVAMPGHKGLFGPQGTGILLCRDGGVPLLYGGSGSDSILQTMPEYLPDRLEAGTQNVCGIAGLLAGIRYVQETGTRAIFNHEKQLLHSMTEQLSQCETITLYTGPDDKQSGVLSVLVSGSDSEETAQQLSERGVCVRGGLHCAPIAHESAGTIKSGTVRFSFSPFNDEQQVDIACRHLIEITELISKKN